MDNPQYRTIEHAAFDRRVGFNMDSPKPAAHGWDVRGGAVEHLNRQQFDYRGNQQFMYHYSPGEGKRVASIKQHGLLPRDPATGHSYAEESGHPAGVYLFREREQADMLDDGDVWGVNVEGLDDNIHPDPFTDDASSWYHKGTIPPDRVKHLGPAGGHGDSGPW